MKLFHLVMWRVSALLVAILTVWAVFFYWAIIEEVNDETDDSLGDYAETLIIRWLSGEEMPSKNSGSNNQYYLYEVSEEYARSYPPHYVPRRDGVYRRKKRNRAGTCAHDHLPNR